MYNQIIQMVQSAGAQAVLDTSGPPLRYGCEAKPFLAKPNTLEAGELTGIKQITTQPQVVTKAIHKLGVKNILISMGQAGALFSDGERIWLAEPPEIEERNPIGAGDSSVAGLVWGIDHHLDWPDTLRWSMACGAAAASLAGTAVGSKEIIETLAEQVKIVEL
jgi:fructose-1-phosphate kinase PfkB-like protein